ncbi:MAG: DUF1499 domain-containing protein [Burkholderiales bacterium]|jgi:uncharacterized protein (DUF1499 family)|nr:DUF1499 domain-containing protein [Burkholderiales bacterium]
MRIALIVVVVVALLVLGAGQLGLFSGRMPDDLGVREGRLEPPSRTENSVSSQAALHDGDGARYAAIDPLRYGGDGAAALTKIGRIVMAMPGARIMRSGPDYLYVQFHTRWLKFVDDAEFWVDPAGGVIHVRSASRLGRKDFGVNRARIEAIRARFAATG